MAIITDPKTGEITLILVHYKDASHGWIECPSKLIDELNIISKISPYSYYSAKLTMYYLEEDRDALLLLEALDSKGYSYKLYEVNHEPRSPIRDLHHVFSYERQA